MAGQSHYIVSATVIVQYLLLDHSACLLLETTGLIKTLYRSGDHYLPTLHDGIMVQEEM